jgi:hypothetical protein
VSISKAKRGERISKVGGGGEFARLHGTNVKVDHTQIGTRMAAVHEV